MCLVNKKYCPNIEARFLTAFFEAQYYFGEMAEWLIAAVLKTVEGQPSEGSNPSLPVSTV